jgi:hypothetical protein
LATKKRQKQLNKQRKAREYREKGSLVIMPADPSQGIPKVNYSQMLKAIADRDGKVWDAIVQYLMYFNEHHYQRFGLDALHNINDFVQCVFTATAFEDFNPSPQQTNALIQTSHIFQHTVAISSHRDTSAALDCTLGLQNNLPKIMMLMNARSVIQLDQSKLFDTNPHFASLWYTAYLLGISTPTKLIQTNIYRHLANMDDRWTPPNHNVSGLYFGCTYHNAEAARRCKGIMNKAIKKISKIPEFVNNPDPKSIAIVTGRWHRNHAVYKSASQLVEQLVGKYKLTLVWTGDPKHMPATVVDGYFDKVCHCYFKPNGELIIPDELKDNDFQMVYYPDIGMSDESIWLSNTRIAPIQAVGYGHPDTTGDNNEIDYFIGGDVEKEATDQYAETMVLLPGLAQEPAWPTAERQNNYCDDDIVRINCVWGPDKYNYTLLTVLAEINAGVDRVNEARHQEAMADGSLVDIQFPRHEIHFFGSPGMNRYNTLPAFIRDVKQMLPNVVIHTEQEYYDYMKNAEMHDFTLNSFPFGCYNVLVESLYMGLPFLTMVGNRFYNRAGMYLNDQIGMEENNFDSPRGLIDKAVTLITNPEELKRQRDFLASVDLKEKLFTLKGNHFLEAVEHIIAAHPFTDTKIIGDAECRN